MAYNGFIWTNHAIDRLKDRKISRESVIKTLANPDRTIEKGDGATEFQKIIDTQTVAAIIKENERGGKIILSCWVNPPNPGTADFKKKKRYKAMQNASFAKKLWLTFLDQIGL